MKIYAVSYEHALLRGEGLDQAAIRTLTALRVAGHKILVSCEMLENVTDNHTKALAPLVDEIYPFVPAWAHVIIDKRALGHGADWARLLLDGLGTEPKEPEKKPAAAPAAPPVQDRAPQARAALKLMDETARSIEIADSGIRGLDFDEIAESFTLLPTGRDEVRDALGRAAHACASAIESLKKLNTTRKP